MSRLLEYDSGSFSILETGLGRDVRWIAWKHDGSLALLIGNAGLMAVFQDGDIRAVPSGTKENLRGASFKPQHDEALVVGNNGTVLTYSGGSVRRIETGVTSNLRRVAWGTTGETALLIGNGGTALQLAGGSIMQVSGSVSNLRGISFRPGEDLALLCANRFSEEFVPSPNLFTYRDSEQALSPLLDEVNADLTGVAWDPSGSRALAVGYDLTWHDPRIFQTDGENVEELMCTVRSAFPSSISWLPSGKCALITTATTEPRISKGTVLAYADERFEPILALEDFYMVCVACHPTRDYALVAGSPSARMFSA